MWHDNASEGGYRYNEAVVKAVVYDTSGGNCGGARRDYDGRDIDIGDGGGDVGEGRNNAGEKQINRDQEMKDWKKDCFILAMKYKVWGCNLSKTPKTLKIHKPND